MIKAFFKAILEVIAEIIYKAIKKDEKITDADEVPKSIRARFRAKYNRLMRDNARGGD